MKNQEKQVKNQENMGKYRTFMKLCDSKSTSLRKSRASLRQKSRTSALFSEEISVSASFLLVSCKHCCSLRSISRSNAENSALCFRKCSTKQRNSAIFHVFSKISNKNTVLYTVFRLFPEIYRVLYNFNRNSRFSQ